MSQTRAIALSAMVGALVLGAGGAQSQAPASNPSFVLGSELYTRCQAAGADPGPCIMYVAGAIDQALAYEGTLRASGATIRTFCLPADSTPRKVTAVVMKYLTDHPEVRQYTAASDVHAAMMLAYPCPTSPAPQ